MSYALAMTPEPETARRDALRGVRYQLGRCEDAIDLAHMTLIAVGEVEPEWSQQFRLDIEVLRSKLASLASLAGPEPEAPTGDPSA